MQRRTTDTPTTDTRPKDTPAKRPTIKATLVIAPDLWHRLRVRALEEHTTASALLSTLAARYLAPTTGGRR